jgi:threonine-phosphate decarboxylase
MEEIYHIHGGNIWAEGEKYGLKSQELLDFSANINPLGPSQLALEAIKNNLDLVKDYPDPHCSKLRKALGEFLHINPNQIVMGNGAVELIYLLVKYLKPQNILIPAPTFSEYEIAAKINDCQVHYLPLDHQEFALPVQEIINKLPKIDLVFICNPNNPTGRLTLAQEILEIVKAAEKTNTYVVVDEAFMDFVAEDEKFSVLPYINQFKNLFVLYSLTKFYGIPGLRLGAGIGPEEIVKGLNQIRDPWNVNCFAQLAGEVSLRDREYIKSTKEYVQAEKDFLYDELCRIKGLKPYKPSVNYIFINIKATGLTSSALKKCMGAKGILVRDCSSYVNLGEDYIRVAVKRREDNERLIKGLQGLLLED